MQGKTVGVGVTGGIAAYKVADLVSRLTKEGHDVHVIMTRAASQFITPLTMKTLSGNPVLIDMFDENSPWKVQHIGIAEQAEVLVIAPATANIIGKMACGIADDLLSTVVLATRAPVLVVPSMNTNMYENPIVQENINRLRKHGFIVMEPEAGELACGVSGRGRLPNPDSIYEKIMEILSPDQSLKGWTFLVTAGATQEDMDPVRFITNRSTGKMGYALASEAARRGAKVFLVTGPTHLEYPSGVEVIPVRSAREMREAAMQLYPDVDVVIAAAAVADYRPLEYSSSKIKKSDEDLVLKLTRNPDILGEMGQKKGHQILVGFAAETDEVLNNGRAKLEKKNLDLLVANDVTAEGAGFGSDTNIVTMIFKDGTTRPLPRMAKTEVARAIIDAILEISK